MEDGNCFAVTNQHSSAVYVTLRSFRVSVVRYPRFAPPRSGISCACRRSRTPTSDVGTVRARHGRSRGDHLTGDRVTPVSCRALRAAHPTADPGAGLGPRRIEDHLETALSIL